MNSLNIDLKEGQKAVMEGDIPEHLRVVTLTGGFGMSKDTAGTGLFVLTADGSRGKMSSMEIEKLVE